MDIEAVIAEANAQPAKVETAAPEQETLATSEEAQVTETSEETPQETDDVSKKPDSELTPEQMAKREANRQSHLNRKLAKQRLRDENAQLKARLAELERSTKPQQQSAPSDYPSESDYDSVIDYMKAVAKYEAKQEFKAAQETKAEVSVDTSKVQRLQEMATHEAEFAKKVPDYEKLVYQDNAHIMNNMPKHVAEALLDADDASLALYALAKEGSLEDLEDLEGKALDKALAKAEERGRAYIAPQNKVTNAPAPMSPLKGASSGSKTIYNMPVDQLLKHFNTR